MKKVLSAKQRRANRRNARRSTGPRTPAGKARSSRNAIKHGLLAKDVVIPTSDLAERQADFDAVLADLVREFQPHTFIEETLVERIATCYWRLRRAQRFESGAIRGALEVPDAKAAIVHDLRNQIASCQVSLDHERHMVEILEKPENERTPDESSEIQKAIERFHDDQPIAEGFDADDSIQVLRSVGRDLIGDYGSRIASLRARLEAAEREQAADDTRRTLTATLPERDSLLKLIRYENMLDRQLHRALAELRRLRQVPQRDTSRKKRTCKTNPSDTRA